MDICEAEVGMVVRLKKYCQPLMIVGLDRNTEFAEVKEASVSGGMWSPLPPKDGIRRFWQVGSLDAFVGKNTNEA